MRGQEMRACAWPWTPRRSTVSVVSFGGRKASDLTSGTERRETPRWAVEGTKIQRCTADVAMAADLALERRDL